MVNFRPTEDLYRYINLKNRVEARMALVDVAATGQDDLLNTDAIWTLAADELHYRDQQLLRLREEVLDLEELADTATLNEFTLDDFRIELARYLESNREALESASLGLYAVVRCGDPAGARPGLRGASELTEWLSLWRSGLPRPHVPAPQRQRWGVPESQSASASAVSIARTPGAIRGVKPVSTRPGPASTVSVTPSAASRRIVSVHRTQPATCAVRAARIASGVRT